jgi:ParB family chromosome partitioning protein
MTTISVSPLRCRVWSLHARLDENLTEETCRAEIESFEKHGQLIPALGRRLRGNRDYDIELIYGARRLFVARHLNVPLLVDVREIADREGIVAMDLENRVRQDLSAFERGTSYDRWLREGHFSSQHEIANTLQVSAAQISRLLKLARLPKPIIEAFSKATDICEVWGAELANLLRDQVTEQRMVQAARSIALMAPRPSAEETYKQLCSAAKAATHTATRVVKDEDGNELFRVKHQRGNVVFDVRHNLLSQDLLNRIESVVARILDPRLPDLCDESSEFADDDIVVSDAVGLWAAEHS